MAIEHLGERLFDGQDGLPDGVFELRLGLAGGGLGGIDAPAALFPAFEEARDLGAVGVGVGGALGGEGDVGAVDGEVGVGADGGLDLLGADGAEVGLGGEEGRVVVLRHGDDLLEAEGVRVWRRAACAGRGRGWLRRRRRLRGSGLRY